MPTHAGSYAKNHSFEGELRIKVNKRIYPDIDAEGVMELAQRVLEGEDVDGVIVEKFEVRGEDKTNEVSKNYEVAAGFMQNARRIGQGDGS